MNHTKAFMRRDHGGRRVGDGDEPHENVHGRDNAGRKVGVDDILHVLHLSACRGG